MSTRWASGMKGASRDRSYRSRNDLAGPRAVFPARPARLQVQLVQLLEDAVDLGEELLALLPERAQLGALRLEGLEPGLQRIALRSQLGDDLGRPAHRLLELGQTLSKIVRHWIVRHG